MTSDHSEEWVRKSDEKFEQQNRRVVLRVDNCQARPAISWVTAIQLLKGKTPAKTNQSYRFSQQ